MVWVFGWCRGNSSFFFFSKLQKEWGCEKGRDSNMKRESFFLFYRLKLMSHFVTVIHVSAGDTTLKERCLG